MLRQVWQQYLVGELDEHQPILTAEEIQALFTVARTPEERDLIQKVLRLIDPGLRIEHVPYAQAYAPSFEDIRHRVPDLTRIQQAIGYRPQYALEDILRAVLDWRRVSVPRTSA